MIMHQAWKMTATRRRSRPWKQDKAAALRVCINKLSNEHREVIDLVYYQEKAIKEIAVILEVPENTVKTRVFHARKKLSELMSKAGLDRGWP